MNSTDRLTEALRRQAAALPDQHPLSLTDVQTRARSIRRRRYAATGLAAAAVLAVVVPLGHTLGDRLDRSTGPAGDPDPGVGRAQRLPLTTDLEAATSPPGTAYVVGDAVHLADGVTLSVTGTGTYDTLVPFGDRWLVGGDLGDGERFAAVFVPTGRETERFATQGRIAVAADGSLAAYVDPGDGVATTLDRNGEHRRVPLTVPGSSAAGGSFTVTAVHPCNAADDCLLLADVSVGRRPLTVEVDRDGTSREAGFLKVGDRSVDGTVAGRVTSGDTEAVCSTVRPPAGRGWDTCSWELGRFSPDGRFLIGFSLEDGRGPRTLAVLDAQDGTVIREYAAPGRADVFIRQAVWESEDSVLATVWDTDHWSVLRLGVDGSRAEIPVEGIEDSADPDAPPVFLAARPSPS